MRRFNAPPLLVIFALCFQFHNRHKGGQILVSCFGLVKFRSKKKTVDHLRQSAEICHVCAVIVMDVSPPVNHCDGWGMMNGTRVLALDWLSEVEISCIAGLKCIWIPGGFAHCFRGTEGAKKGSQLSSPRRYWDRDLFSFVNWEITCLATQIPLPKTSSSSPDTDLSGVPCSVVSLSAGLNSVCKGSCSFLLLFVADWGPKKNFIAHARLILGQLKFGAHGLACETFGNHHYQHIKHADVWIYWIDLSLLVASSCSWEL